MRSILENCLPFPYANKYQLKEVSENQRIFVQLFNCWCHNPAAVFSLCLLAHVYDLSATLIHSYHDANRSVGFLVQIEKLLQLIETPAFLSVRLDLLQVNCKYHPELLKSLHGLLNFVSQSAAYKGLSQRLKSVSTLQMHIGFGLLHGDYETVKLDVKDKSSTAQNVLTHTKSFLGSFGKSTKDQSLEINTKLDYNALLTRYGQVQKLHKDFNTAHSEFESVAPKFHAPVVAKISVDTIPNFSSV